MTLWSALGAVTKIMPVDMTVKMMLIYGEGVSFMFYMACMRSPLDAWNLPAWSGDLSILRCSWHCSEISYVAISVSRRDAKSSMS